MAAQSVTTLHPTRVEPVGTECDLIMSEDDVLTVYVTRHSMASPPDEKTATKLHFMVCSLARASMALANEMVRDERDAELWRDAAKDVAFVTMMFSQLADAAMNEMNAGMQEATP